MKSKSSTERDSLLDAINEINSVYGEGSIQWLGSKAVVPVERVSTGCVSLDLALGGGIPKNRIIELYGNESSGKTTLSLHIIAEFQKLGHKAAFVDAEHALDPEYAQKIGVNTDSLLLSQPDGGEQALEIVERIIRSGEIAVIVIDSVAALTPRAELEGEMGQSHMGLQARLMSQALRKLTALASNKKCTLIFLNQLRMKIGEQWGNPETTTGGRALRFYASVRVDLRRRKPTETGTGDDKEAIGNLVGAKIVKNKVAPPFKRTEFEIRYNMGIDRVGDILNTAEKLGIVKRKGAFYDIPPLEITSSDKSKDTQQHHKLQGFEKARQFLIDKPKFSEKLLTQILCPNSSQSTK